MRPIDVIQSYRFLCVCRVRRLVILASICLLVLATGCREKTRKVRTVESKTDIKSAIPSPDDPKKTNADSAAVARANATLKNLGAHIGVNSRDEIELVDLSGTSVSNGNLRELSGLENSLKWISLNDTQTNDDSVRILTDFHNLVGIELNRTKITDDAVGKLKTLKQLQELSLKGTKIGDSALAHLGSMNKLTHVSISGTKVSDEGLRHLARLENLQTLLIEDVPVSNAGLNHLRSLKSLRFVYTSGSRINETGRRIFRSKIRGVTILP